MDYQDFVLQLDRAPGEQGFLTRVIRSPAGEAEAPFVNPIEPSELDGLWQAGLAAMQASRGCSTRDLGAPAGRPAMDAVAAELSFEAMGDRLFRALLRGPVHGCWARSLAESTQGPEGGLRLKLQLNLADPLLAPFAELPWEYLFSLEHGGFLGLQRKTPILRHMRLPLPGGKAPAAQPLRLLIVASQPSSMPPLSLGNEGEKIAAALGTLPGVETLTLHNPSVETLRDTLLRQDFHVLHFMGHGGFDPGSGQGVLYFADTSGAPVPVGGGLLASHLAGLDSLRLVFVNACDTARSHSRSPFAGVATALLRAGLPAVVAMQRPIRDGSALEFSRTVYRRLAAGDPIDAAVTEGRLAIARGHGALLEWGTPVLFLRAEDGRLFASEPTAAPSPPLSEPLPAPPAAAPRKARNLFLLAGVLALGLGLGAAWWPFGQERQAEPVKRSDPPVEERRLPAPQPEPTPLQAETKPPAPVASKPKTVKVQEPPAEKPSDPKPLPTSSSYVVSEDSPVSIPGLEAEVGARFFERDGYSFARFWVSPPGEGMLQQPPVMRPGGLAFPARDGTYHLDILSLDPVQKNARVRLRFVQ
ncbi:MAG TPA: CHAT domain-containing protein [Thermoanaerobaculia bacterium]|nr:CHAT domain-containing protein [Thermoanaerobaculia bacterium]